MYLPIFESPKPDELWQGYIMRLAMMNDYQSLDDFEHKYLYGIERRKRSGAMFPESLTKACDRMSSLKGFPTVEEAIRMTPYYAEASGLPEGKQAKLAESILYDINEPVTPNIRTQKKFYFCICPDCQKEDMAEHGHWYFHLKHHLPEVQVCTKHKVPLIRMDRFDKRVSCMPKFKKKKTFLIENMSDALTHAYTMESSFEKNRNILTVVLCPECGKKYITHLYSHHTGAGCPFCRNKMPWGELIQHRLDILYKGEYSLSGAFSELSTAEVIHLPCGLSKQNLEQLLWDKRGMCSSCKAVTVSKLQKQIDPDKKEFIIRKLYRTEKNSRMVSVTHLDCRRTFDIQVGLFRDDPHCKLCEKEQRAMENSLEHPDYAVVSEYLNNHDTIWLRHKECGCIFPTSKTSFLAGMRCPVCTNHYDFTMVSEAVRECTNGYVVEKGKKRGDVIVYHQGSVLARDISYTKVMNDLQLDVPELLTDRKKKYQPPKSIRRIIYDAVKESTKEKGFWEGKDGIGGQPYTRRERNILQDLANQGYIKRIEKGKYRI
ncbi:MAG: TniQ family protein [Fusicatenibacter sp.]